MHLFADLTNKQSDESYPIRKNRFFGAEIVMKNFDKVNKGRFERAAYLSFISEESITRNPTKITTTVFQ